MMELRQLARRGAIVDDSCGERPAARARARYEFHQERIAGERESGEPQRAEKGVRKRAQLAQASASPNAEPKQAAIQRAIERARARRKHDARTVDTTTSPGSTPKR
jgi:hypothetical protein